MKNKTGKAIICVCLFLWLSTHTSQAHCRERATTASIKLDGTSNSIIEESRQQDYLTSFHGINQQLLNPEVVKNIDLKEAISTSRKLSLLGSSRLSTHQALAHHIYVKTESDIEKLILQFPLKQDIMSTHGVLLENLLGQMMRLSMNSIFTDLLSLDLINDSAAYRIRHNNGKTSEVVFDFDLTQQGLVQKGKIVSLFFHYLHEFLHSNTNAIKGYDNVAAVTQSIFSIDSMRLWHFSNDQLTKKKLANPEIKYSIKPFSKYDLKLFKQKYPRSLSQYFLGQYQGDLIYNDSGLNIWIPLKKGNRANDNSNKVYLRGNNYHHNIENYVSLNILLAALNTSGMESVLSTNLPFAIELSKKTNDDLLPTFEMLKSFTLNSAVFKKAKLTYLQQIKQEKPLKKIALIELDKATLSTVNLWSKAEILEAIDAIEIEQVISFHKLFLKSLSIDIVLTNDQLLAQLPSHIAKLEQLFLLDKPNNHLNHYNQYYIPAVGTLLNKRLHIHGDKNFLLDVYISPVKTSKQALSIKMIVAALRSLLKTKAPWLKTSYKQVNVFPSIYFHVDGKLKNMGEAKAKINKLVLSIKPEVKSYIINNFKALKDSHFNNNSPDKYSIRPSDIMRVYDDIFLNHKIENILIQLKGKQNQTQFFVALAGEPVR
jgi:hypothetical protein